MFRIDKTLVSYDLSEREYTTVSIQTNAAGRYADRGKAGEEKLKAQWLTEMEGLLQIKTKDAEKKSSAILQSAQTKAGELVRRAEADAAGIRAEAEKAGYRDGKRRAEEEMQARMSKQAEALQNLMAEAGKAREAMVEELQDEIISLVLETAKKVINVELERDDKIFMGLVQNALSRMKREGKLIIRVSREDYVSLFSAGSAEFTIDSERIKATVLEEPLFLKGDCVIDSEGETIDAGIASQMRHIEFAFRNAESYEI